MHQKRLVHYRRIEKPLGNRHSRTSVSEYYISTTAVISAVLDVT